MCQVKRSEEAVYVRSLVRVFACPQLIAKDSKVLHADNEDSDQTARMNRLDRSLHWTHMSLSRFLWFLTVTCSCCPYLSFGSAIMLVTYFSKMITCLGKSCSLVQFTARAFRKRLSIYVFSYMYFPFWFWGQDVGSDCISFWSLLIFLLYCALTHLINM